MRIPHISHLFFIAAVVITLPLGAKSWQFTAEQCQGSLRPYPAPAAVAEYPDTLTPVMINHVGRHGSRYPASATSANTMRRALQHADSLGTITPLGHRFARLIDRIIATTANRWGQLDSLGIDELRGIASRINQRYPTLVAHGRVRASASYSHRAIMSMYAFTHQLSLHARDIEITTQSGRSNNALLCPFDINADYKRYIADKPYQTIYKAYVDTLAPNTATRLLGQAYPATEDELRQLSIVEYYNLANLEAMGLPLEYEPYMTLDEMNRLWSCFNLRQYFQHTAQAVSTLPADIITPLITDIIATGDRAGNDSVTIHARFAHAETILPLVSKLGLAKCAYLTDEYNTVASHWQDHNIVPMAANVQLIHFTSPSGTIYVRLDLNEHPIPLLPNDSRIYIPWPEAREHLRKLIG